jgi:hypothetical protein
VVVFVTFPKSTRARGRRSFERDKHKQARAGGRSVHGHLTLITTLCLSHTPSFCLAHRHPTSIRSARYCHPRYSQALVSRVALAATAPLIRLRPHTQRHSRRNTLPLPNFLATAQGYCFSSVGSAHLFASASPPTLYTIACLRLSLACPDLLQPPRHWRHTQSRWALKWEVCTRSLST